MATEQKDKFGVYVIIPDEDAKETFAASVSEGKKGGAKKQKRVQNFELIFAIYKQGYRSFIYDLLEATLGTQVKKSYEMKDLVAQYGSQGAAKVFMDGRPAKRSIARNKAISPEDEVQLKQFIGDLHDFDFQTFFSKEQTQLFYTMFERLQPIVKSSLTKTGEIVTYASFLQAFKQAASYGTGVVYSPSKLT